MTRLFAATSLIATLAIVTVLVLRGYLSMHTWMYSYYFLNYEFEFVRRGFIGEILRVLRVPLSNQTASISFIAAFLACWTFFIVAAVRLFRLEPRFHILLFFVFTGVCPALTLHFAWMDFGRLDIFIVLLLFISILAVVQLEFLFALAVVTVLQVFACLVHEAALFMTAPLAFTLLSYHFKQSVVSGPIVIALVIVGMMTMAIWTFGDLEAVSFEDLVAHYNERSLDGKAVDPGAIGVVNGDLSSAMWTLFYGFRRTLFEHLFFFVGLFPFIVIIVQAGRTLPLPGGATRFALAAAVLSPLLLYPLGHDFFRWWSFVFLNAFVAVFFIVLSSTEARRRLSDLIKENQYFIFTGIALGLLLGGTGDKDSFRTDSMPIAYLITWMSP